jgi:hypothetical protein
MRKPEQATEKEEENDCSDCDDESVVVKLIAI